MDLFSHSMQKKRTSEDSGWGGGCTFPKRTEKCIAKPHKCLWVDYTILPSIIHTIVLDAASHWTNRLQRCTQTHTHTHTQTLTHTRRTTSQPWMYSSERSLNALLLRAPGSVLCGPHADDLWTLNYVMASAWPNRLTDVGHLTRGLRSTIIGDVWGLLVCSVGFIFVFSVCYNTEILCISRR